MTAKTINELLQEFNDPEFTYQDFLREKMELEYKFLEAYEITPDKIDEAISDGTLPCHNALVERWTDLMAIKDRVSPEDPPKKEQGRKVPKVDIEQLGSELERAALIFAGRVLERANLRISEGANLVNPEVAEARRALRAIAVKFSAAVAVSMVDE
jgi:hypothetical protein